MRGDDSRLDGLFSDVRSEDRIPKRHPLRVIRQLANAALDALSPRFDELYAQDGRPSIPPEQLLRALLLQAFYSICSERQLMEHLNYNLPASAHTGAQGQARGAASDRSQRLYRREERLHPIGPACAGIVRNCAQGSGQGSGMKRMARAVVVILDGLRRDFVDAVRTPHLAEFVERAERFPAYRSAFPSATRVVTATFATGCHPARHGLQGNSMALLENGALVPHDVGLPGFLQHKRAITGHALAVPTMAERLAPHGGAIVYNNVSPGAAYAHDPDGYWACLSSRRLVCARANQHRPAEHRIGHGRRPGDDGAFHRRRAR